MPSDRRKQIQLTPDEQAAFFRERKKAALATIDKDRSPHRRPATTTPSCAG
jgi:hypothetical protein